MLNLSGKSVLHTVPSITSGVFALWKVLKSRQVQALKYRMKHHELSPPKKELMKSRTHHADAQYTERNRLDLAIPRRLFPKIV